MRLPKTTSRAPGFGYVDIFDANGNLVKRLVSQGALNSPWGLAKAPADFGDFSNDLLVGNFGDGTINAYDPATGSPISTLSDKNSLPIHIGGLWAIQFGQGANNQPTNVVFFSAGSGGEEHGLYGRIS